MMANSDVIFEELTGRDGNLGLITLNRQSALNALNHAMLLAIHKQLIIWEQAEHIKAVVIKAAEGRAFCAGGDIRYAYEQGLKKDPALPLFFRDEYLLNKCIFHYPKPYIALLDGITMGGGAGISVHGSHRVATEKLLFAMPETAIGFFPDVGASYFLPRLPYKTGFYLGLSSSRIAYNDCVSIGIATHCIASTSFPTLIHQLADTSLLDNPKAQVSAIIDTFAVDYPASELLQQITSLEVCFSHQRIEDILLALQNDTTAWAQKAFLELTTKSPTSLKVTLAMLLQGATMKFDDCMNMEYRLTNRFLESKDFFEGVRAAVIDKDQKPHWQPAHLSAVSDAVVEKFFAPLEHELMYGV